MNRDRVKRAARIRSEFVRRQLDDQRFAGRFSVTTVPMSGS